MDLARLRDLILEEVRGYSDVELVQVAWEEFHAFDAPGEIKDPLEEDLREAERQVTEDVALSLEGRGRLRSFLYNKRLQEQLQFCPNR